MVFEKLGLLVTNVNNFPSRKRTILMEALFWVPQDLCNEFKIRNGYMCVYILNI